MTTQLERAKKTIKRMIVTLVISLILLDLLLIAPYFVSDLKTVSFMMIISLNTVLIAIISVLFIGLRFREYSDEKGFTLEYFQNKALTENLENEESDLDPFWHEREVINNTSENQKDDENVVYDSFWYDHLGLDPNNRLNRGNQKITPELIEFWRVDKKQ